MYEAPVISAEEEQALLQNWFETVHFDVEDEGIPELDPEKDDEEPEARARIVENLDFDVLMEELRKRDPDNPF